jgi:hypothetical protein
MSHQCETCFPLKVENLKIDNIVKIKTLDPSISAVWFFALPYNSSFNELELTKDFIEILKEFSGRAGDETIMCFLASPQLHLNYC